MFEEEVNTQRMSYIVYMGRTIHISDNDKNQLLPVCVLERKIGSQKNILELCKSSTMAYCIP